MSRASSITSSRDYQAALRPFQRGRGHLPILLDGITSGPKPVQLLDPLALAHYNIATIEHGVRPPEAALDEFGRSLAYRDALVDRPSVGHPVPVESGHEPRRDRQAPAPGEAGRARRSPRSEKSIDVLEKLVRSQPDQSRFRAELGRSWNILGFLHDEARENDQALPAFEHAVKEADRPWTNRPEVDQYKFNSIYILDNLGEQYVDLGRAADGLPYYRRAIALAAGAARRPSGRPGPALDLAKSLSNLGTILRHAGESAAARQSFARAREVLDPIADAAPADAALQARSARSSTERPWPWPTRAGQPRRSPILRRAVAILKPPGVTSTGEDQARGWLTESLWDLGRLLRAAGSRRGSRPARRRTPGPLEGPPPRPGQAGPPADPPGRPDRLRQDAHRRTRPVGPRPDLDQAADHLRMAVSLGFRDLALLRADPDSWLLLSRADLRLLSTTSNSPNSLSICQPQK